MRRELLNIIKCPACGAGKRDFFNLIENENSSLEIKNAILKCMACNQSFKVENGILDLLYEPDPEVLEEKSGIVKALQEAGSKYDEAMLLSLPESAESNNPFDSSYKYSLNFYRVLDELNIKGNELVLDLGSGNTWSSCKLAKMGCRCVALDISTPKYKGLESAETYFKFCSVYYERVVSDMKKLPFCDGSFDIVMSNSSIHHALSLKSVLREINRVLKKNGRLVLINEAVCSIFSPIRDKNRKNLPEFVKRLNWTENTYSITQYLRYIKTAGFHKIKVLFPPAVNEKLTHLKAAKPGKKDAIKYRLARIISFVWSRHFPGFIKKIIFWPAIIVFGMPLLLIAEKKNK